ncbi:MAG: hypothetical protein ACRCVT_07680 [Leadbetterella sp.]
MSKKTIDYATSINQTDWDALMISLRSAETTLGRFSVSLSDKERSGRRTIAEGREGYVREVQRVATEFENSLPRSFDVRLFEQKMQLFNQWKQLLITVEKIAEMVDDTTLQLGTELMTDVDTVYPVLQTMRRVDANLDRALQALDDYNSRFGGSGTPTEPMPTTSQNTTNRSTNTNTDSNDVSI